MTTLCAISAAIFGIAAYFSLPVSELPDVAYPVISVTTNYPGASPQIMANNISTPLEIQMMQIEGLHLITSRNQEGVSSIVLQFVLDKDMGQAEAEVEAAIQRAMGNLPTDLPAPPSFQTVNPNTQPIVYITMATDTLTLGDLYDYANNMVAQRMMMLEGVSNGAGLRVGARGLHPNGCECSRFPRPDRARRGQCGIRPETFLLPEVRFTATTCNTSSIRRVSFFAPRITRI